VTLNSGIYYIDGGGLSVNGGATITGSGVTLVFTKKTGNSWPTVTINGNATVNLTPPKSGPTAGIVIFGDRNMPAAIHSNSMAIGLSDQHTNYLLNRTSTPNQRH
jgi:hypothetical protein